MIFAKDLIYSIAWLIKEKRGFDLYVGADGINCVAGLFLRRLGVVKRVVFYTIDYTPTRFANPVLNQLYVNLDRYCVQNSDFTWNLSPRMSQARWHSQTGNHGREITVPIGVRLDRIQPRSIDEIDRHALAFIGHLRRGHGIELVVRALPTIISHVPKTRLVVIGSGPIEEELKRTAKKLGLNDKITFVGFMRNHEDAERILASCSIGLAVYEPVHDNFSFYTDPGKPKLYLACGLPTIITAVPLIAEVISDRKMGIVVRFDEEQVAQAAIQLLTDNELYESYRKNALDYAQELDWGRIFEDALKDFFAIRDPSTKHNVIA
jgi:glycosyltransferase involved in cell wall biosynthesis